MRHHSSLGKDHRESPVRYADDCKMTGNARPERTSGPNDPQTVMCSTLIACRILKMEGGAEPYGSHALSVIANRDRALKPQTHPSTGRRALGIRFRLEWPFR